MWTNEESYKSNPPRIIRVADIGDINYRNIILGDLATNLMTSYKVTIDVRFEYWSCRTELFNSNGALGDDDGISRRRLDELFLYG